MFRTLKKLSFIIGIFIGVLLAVLLKIATTSKKAEPVRRPFQVPYDTWFKRNHLTRREILFDSLRYSNKTYLLESDLLYNQIDVFCMILVKTAANARAAENTWARHCNRVQLLNLVSERKKVPILKRNKEKSSWALLCQGLKQVPARHDWILVVYDYTFVLVENLRLFLASLDHRDKHYLGHAVKFWSTVYNMGQAGYVLSKGSLEAFKGGFESGDSCVKSLTYMNLEDYYLGRSLAGLGIEPVDTRDAKDLSTFHPYNLQHVFFPGQNFYKFSVYPHSCCSPFTIAFQGIEGSKMYTYYYLLYRLQLFYDGNLGNKPASHIPADEEIWKDFLRGHNKPLNVTREQYYTIWKDVVNDPVLFNQHLKVGDSDYIN